MQVTTILNSYQDKLIQAGEGCGADIAVQRQDELDLKSEQQVRSLLAMGRAARVLDLGAGRGAQAARLLRAGASLSVAVDIYGFVDDFAHLTSAARGRAIFVQTDLNSQDWPDDVCAAASETEFDVVIFQRTIHYLPYLDAIRCLKKLRSLMATGSRLYLSASGLDSELGRGYAHRHSSLTDRFHCLTPEMADKHGIKAPVCLYRLQELQDLCGAAGYCVVEAELSAFGNIKVVADLKA